MTSKTASSLLHSTILLCLTVALAACGGPTLTLPGGALEGERAEVPADWAFIDDVSTIQLETRPSQPYSVNIWVIGLGSNLYVHAGDNRATWVENMDADPQVRLRVGEAIYELASARVEEQAEFDRFADAYEKKYGRRPGNENVAEVYLYRLTAR